MIVQGVRCRVCLLGQHFVQESLPRRPRCKRAPSESAICLLTIVAKELRCGRRIHHSLAKYCQRAAGTRHTLRSAACKKLQSTLPLSHVCMAPYEAYQRHQKRHASKTKLPTFTAIVQCSWLAAADLTSTRLSMRKAFVEAEPWALVSAWNPA